MKGKVVGRDITTVNLIVVISLAVYFTLSFLSLKTTLAYADVNGVKTDSIEKTENTDNKYTSEQLENINIYCIMDKYKHELVLFILVIAIAVVGIVYYVMLEQKKGRMILWNMAYIDSLTGISNLSKFKMDFENLLDKNNKEQYELVRFDVEKFKIINDMYGFGEGDRVLHSIVKAVKENLKNDELFARISNDDFVILIKFNPNSDDEKRIRQIFDSFVNAHMMDNILYRIDFNVGIYKIKSDATDFNSMLDKVTMAHKTAKTMESNSIVVFNDNIRNDAIRTKEVENTMVEALYNGEFVVYVQPKFHLENLKVVGAESLIRWNHAERGIILPGEFIQIFEKNGFITNIDNFVLEETCKYQKMLIDKGIKPVTISVNQSKLYIKNPHYVEYIKEIIRKYDIPSNLIELELTETVIHDNIDSLIRITKELRDFGFSISIDDFGSGYSSLNLLKDIQVDIIKIDKEFLKHSEENERGKIVLANIIRLSKELNMQIVTEGVETKEQEMLLKELGSDMVQGFLYARPMPMSEFEKML